jgi:beta-glucosidase
VYKKPGTPEKPGRDYVFMTPDAIWEFGHGLSYTTFAYSDLTVTPVISKDGQATVSVKVKNTGNMKAKEAVLCFVRDDVSSVSTPIRALKGFKKIELAPSEEQTVTFTLGYVELSLFNVRMEQVVEEGTFTVMVGGLSAQFTVK